jgi:hypothetical protein
MVYQSEGRTGQNPRWINFGEMFLVMRTLVGGKSRYDISLRELSVLSDGNHRVVVEPAAHQKREHFSSKFTDMKLRDCATWKSVV